MDSSVLVPHRTEDALVVDVLFAKHAALIEG
jgi:hypothetical protein